MSEKEEPSQRQVKEMPIIIKRPLVFEDIVEDSENRADAFLIPSTGNSMSWQTHPILAVHGVSFWRGYQVFHLAVILFSLSSFLAV